MNSLIQDNIVRLIEDLEAASKKATYSIGSKTNASKSRRKEGRQKESKKMEFFGCRASVIFLSLGGTPVDGDYEPE